MTTVRSETTSAVVALIVDLFGAKAVRDDNTYSLPSDTESVDRLVLNVQARFDVALSVEEIRSSPTIAALAQLIERRAGGRDAPSARGPDIITQFLRTAADRPNVLAVSAAGRTLTYSELRDRAVVLMRRIRAAQGHRTSAFTLSSALPIDVEARFGRSGSRQDRSTRKCAGEPFIRNPNGADRSVTC